MQSQVCSDSTESIETLRGAGGEGTASPEALAEDAIIWASTHGLVLSHICAHPFRLGVTHLGTMQAGCARKITLAGLHTHHITYAA